jgi:hypothetical protein
MRQKMFAIVFLLQIAQIHIATSQTTGWTVEEFPDPRIQHNECGNEQRSLVSKYL